MKYQRLTDRKRARLIRALLVSKGIREEDISDPLGIRRCNVSGVIGGYWESYNIKAVICYKLGVAYESLWGCSCPEPTARRAEALRKAFGIEWTGDGTNKPFEQLEERIGNGGGKYGWGG